MRHTIDYSLYPDLEGPDDLQDVGDAADYIHRVCGALDFGIVPDREVVETMRDLREVFDKHPLIGSPAYHTFRRLFGWPPMKSLRPLQLCYWTYDAREDRGPDPCLEMI